MDINLYEKYAKELLELLRRKSPFVKLMAIQRIKTQPFFGPYFKIKGDKLKISCYK